MVTSYNKDNKRYKLKMNIIIVSALIIFSILFITVFSCYYFKKLSTKNISEKNSTLVTQISSSINDSLESIEKDLKVLSESKEIKTIIEGKDLGSKKVDDFEAYMKFHKEIEAMAFATPDKNLYMYPIVNMGDEYNPTEREWYVKAVETKDYVWSKPYVNDVSGKLLISLSMPVYSKEELSGVMIADINLSYLDKKLEHTKLGETGYVVLADEEGFIYTSPNKEEIGRDLMPDEIKNMLSEDYDHGIISYSEDGRKKIAYISNVNKGNFKLVGIIEEEELYGDISAYFKLIILISILLITMVITICSYLILKGYRKKEEVKTNNREYKRENSYKDINYKDNNLEDKLNRLKEYKLKKVLTEEEYESKRAEIIKNYDI